MGAAALSILFAGAVLGQSQPQQFTICPNGCQSIVLPGGNQLIAEGGAIANHALLLFVDSAGDQLALPFLGGLPSGKAVDGAPFGPVAYFLDGRDLYIAIGEADQFHSGGPAHLNGTSPTPFIPAIIRVTFSADPLNSGPFILRPTDIAPLLNRQTVTTWDFSNNSATLRQIAALHQGARPVGLAKLASTPDMVYVIDSSTSRLLQVNQTTNQTLAIAQFPAQPSSVRVFDDHQLLLTLFSATPGGAGAYLFDPLAGDAKPIAGERTTAIDTVARTGQAGSTFFVLENRSDPQGLGQVLTVDSNGAVTGVLANGLNDATNLAIDESTGRLFVYSRGDGVVYYLPLP